MRKLFGLLAAMLLAASIGCPQGAYAQTKRGYDRIREKIMFIPKGIWSTGGTFSYKESNADQYKLLILDDIDGTDYSFKFSMHIGYSVKDDMSVGARFTYNRSMIKLNSTSINISPDLNFDIQNFNTLNHLYEGAVYLRNYIGLDKGRRFGLFNEVRFSLGGGQGKQLSGPTDDLTGAYQDIFQMQLGIIPGFMAFITNEVAIEASVNVLGLNYKKYSQTRNQVYEGEFENSGVNFKIDILSINIGVCFYFQSLNPLKKRNKTK